MPATGSDADRSEILSAHPYIDPQGDLYQALTLRRKYDTGSRIRPVPVGRYTDDVDDFNICGRSHRPNDTDGTVR